MGGALRALGNGVTGLYLNPANMALTRVYHLMALAQIWPESRRQTYGASGGRLGDRKARRRSGRKLRRARSRRRRPQVDRRARRDRVSALRSILRRAHRKILEAPRKRLPAARLRSARQLRFGRPRAGSRSSMASRSTPGSRSSPPMLFSSASSDRTSPTPATAFDLSRSVAASATAPATSPPKVDVRGRLHDVHRCRGLEPHHHARDGSASSTWPATTIRSDSATATTRDRARTRFPPVSATSIRSFRSTSRCGAPSAPRIRTDR